MESHIAELLVRHVACEHLPTPLTKPSGAAARAPPLATPRQINDVQGSRLANPSILSVGGSRLPNRSILSLI